MIKRISVLFYLIFIVFSLKGQSGDTVNVQTFSFGSPQDAWFLFPSDTVSWEKVIMKYTLKCHPSPGVGNPPYPCGEWDYQTYTYLYEHTGLLDSNLLHHSNFTLDGQSPDSAAISFQATSSAVPVIEYQSAFADTILLQTVTIGNSLSALTVPLNQNDEAFRISFVIPADSLLNQGLIAGNLYGIDLLRDTLLQNQSFQNFKLRLRLTGNSTIGESILVYSSLQTVFSRTLFQPSAGSEMHFVFTGTFYWDGIQNLVVDISYDQCSSQVQHIGLMGQTTTAPAGRIVTDRNMFLDFEGPDAVLVPREAFNTIDSAVTIAFWVYGDPDLQPQRQTNLEGIDSLGNRKINVHLPWGNSNVYWDAGNDGAGYDRINKVAQAVDFEGRWNHWAFTKNVSTGSMKMYLNGTLFHAGSGKVKTMDGIYTFRLGSSAGGGSNYDGFIDDFQVWNKELDPTEIQEWMTREITPSHPDYSHLVLYYPFNQDIGSEVINVTGSQFNGQMSGIPQHRMYSGASLFSNSDSLFFLPAAKIYAGEMLIQTDSMMIISQETNPLQMLVLFSDSLNPTIPTDTIMVYPPQYLLVIDSTGFGLDTISVQSDSMLVLSIWNYYGPPFEVINRYELLRYITPYGINLTLGDEGFSWFYDVSDYMSLLHDSVHLSAGNWQELLDVKFLMIKGTPARKPIHIKNLWTGNYYLSNFETTVLPKTVELLPGTSQYRVKTRASGHGMAMPNNCAEFCPKIHSLVVNGNTVWQWYLWKLCATNPLYPQGGTWIYNRAGWCPGTETDTYNFEITPLIPQGAQSVSIDYNSEYDSGGNYNFEGQFISYGPTNFQTDAAIINVYSPSSEKINGRFNPACNQPRLLIQNNGTQFITTVEFEYGILPDSIQTYTWTGQLDFLDSAMIYLPALDFHNFMDTADRQFSVRILNVNGTPDEYSFNNSWKTWFKSVPVYTKTLVVNFKTNLFPGENTWVLYDANSNVVFSRSGFSSNVLHRDTLSFLQPGCYEIVLYDSDEDGISFWNNDDGSGYFKIRNTSGLGTYATFEPDFGAEIRHQFIYLPQTEGMELANLNAAFSFYPNPSFDEITLEMKAFNQSGLIRIFGLSGNLLFSTETYSGEYEKTIDINFLNKGCYLLEFSIGQQHFRKPLIKL